MTTQPHSTSPGTDPVSELRALFDGRVIAPEDAAYDAARRFLRESEVARDIQRL
jgi:hypothetical protein